MGYNWGRLRINRFRGLDLKTNNTDVVDGMSLAAENVYQKGSGKLALRPGTEVLFDRDETASITADEVGTCTISGTKYYYKFADGKFGHASSLTGALTLISPSPAISTANPIWCAVLDDKLFFVDGTNVLRYFNGTTISDSTILARPTVAPTCAGGPGTLTYLYTVDNGLGESPSSPILSSELSAGTIRVPGNTGPQTLVAGNTVRIYSRLDTIAAGSKLVATYVWLAADVTAGYSDIATVAISDSQTQLYSELGLALNKTAVTALVGISKHAGRLIGWKGSRVYCAKVTNPHAWPDDSAQKEAFVYGLDVGDGESVTVCRSFKESLYVFKASGAAVFGGAGPDDTGNNAFSFRRLQVNEKGCIVGKSAIVIGEDESNYLVWLSRYGFMATDGGSPTPIGEEIESQIQGLADATLVLSTAYYDRKIGHYVCFVGALASRSAWVLDTRQDLGEVVAGGDGGRVGWLKFTGINAKCVFYDSDRAFYGLNTGVCVSQRIAGTTTDFSDARQEYVLDSSINATTNVITVVESYTTGDAVKMRAGVGGTIPANITANTTYYVIRLSATTINLATSAANATAGTAIDIDAGVGTHSLVSSELIENYYTTNWIHFGSPTITKKLGAPSFVVNAVAQTVSLTISMAYDYINVFQDPITLDMGSSDQWGNEAWGIVPWGSGATATPKKAAITRRKVQAIRYKFSVGVINTDFELQGMEQSFAMIRDRGGY